MNKIIIKDIPIGVLLIVLSFFCIYGIMYYTGFPPLLQLIAIVLLSLASFRLIKVGMDLILGIEVSVKNDKK